MDKFKNNSGVFYTKALFLEECTTDPASVLYTLKDEDHKGYPSLYRLYMETSDPTEYSFAQTYLGGFSHWETLTACAWFKPYLTRWRRELEVKIRSQALASIVETGKHADPKTALVANKFLLAGGWQPSTSKRGRPSKEEISKAANEIAVDRIDISDDYKRLLVQ